jgi:L-asparaginase / beta-aspartyl-peptidase
MQYLNEPVHKAAQSVVESLRREGGIGGVIALDDEGNGKGPTCMIEAIIEVMSDIVATPLNCPGMYRGLVRQEGIFRTAIFDDEVLE